jgi:hypothetical protein
MRVVPTPYVSHSVDTLEDVAKVRELIGAEPRVLH